MNAIGSDLRVLLVEDNPADRRLVELGLQDFDASPFTLEGAATMHDALDALFFRPFDAVLLDLNLPDSHGLATLHGVLAAAPSMPVVVLTGLGDDTLAFQAVQQGAQDFLVKGRADGGTLVRSVRYAIERQRALRVSRELEEMRKLQQLRVQFINTAAHEISTPLTPIKLQLHMLKDSELGPLTAKQRRCIGVLERNVDRLNALMQDLLDSSRMHSGRLAMRREVLDVDDVVRDVIEAFREPARLAGIRFAASLHGGKVEADRQRLGQVVLNLLNNAWRFTDKGGSISIATVREGSQVVVKVQDNGRGLSKGDIGRLFQPFTQMHTPSGEAPTGTGLGLYICKGIVEVHGGRIWCESPGLGLGATFAFALPAMASRPVMPPATDLPGPPAGRPAAHSEGRSEVRPKATYG